MSTSNTDSAPTGSYCLALADAVQRGLAQGAPNFRDLLGTVDGADPPSVLSVLERIASAANQQASAAQAMITEARTPLPGTATALPISHPLDYAWMFSEATQLSLLDRIATLTVAGDLIAHLGTPTLHRRAMHALPDRTHVLFDRDRRRVDVANALVPDTAHAIDFLHEAPVAVGAALAIADPPWYPQTAIAFTHAAATVLRPDGQLLLAFPARLTRPEVLKDHENLVEGATRDGMTLRHIESNALRYDTPPFERSAMIARGIPGTPEDWRLGDLWSLQRTSRPRDSPPTVRDERWLAIEIDSIPLRLRPDTAASGTLLLGQLVDGDVLPTVSGRAPERALAALWTSRNRVYRSAEPKALATVLRDLADGVPLPSDPEVQAAARRVVDIVAVERHEHHLSTRETPVPT